jgi:hypothetical protein
MPNVESLLRDHVTLTPASRGFGAERGNRSRRRL